ncbi:DUF5694 domain-containing protein [Saccharospirillum sp. HFRX-1]|uniref:DUF5694 domain-containing protein n=1 Tax=unclassified Saccharospirillum TaxID=2633430 RepID=UPI003718F5EC
MYSRFSSALLIALIICLKPAVSFADEPIQIMLLGVDHLRQLYNDTPESDVFSDKKQAELAAIRDDLAAFAPQQIMVEIDRSEQAQLSANYQAYLNGDMIIKGQPYGRSERYQIGYKLAQTLGLKDLTAADSYDYTPQWALDSGNNIERYQAALGDLQGNIRPLIQAVQNDELSLYDYLALMNQPETISFTHRILFNTPAYVMHGDFSEEAKQQMELDSINSDYIGAEFIGLFYQRNLNIYSNILNAQLESGAQRVLVIFGQLHIGVLQELFANNPNYEIVSPLVYLHSDEAERLAASFAQ